MGQLTQLQEDILVMVSFGVPATISVFFIIAMIIRFMGLRSDIKAKRVNFNFSLTFRIVLLGCEIGADIASVFLVQFVDQYHSYGGLRLMFCFINVSAVLMQIFLMIYEYHKRVPLFYGHKIYWILNWATLVMVLVILLEYSVETFANYAIIILRILLFSTIIIFSLFIKKQDIVEFEELDFFRSTVPDIDVSQDALARSRISTINFGDARIFKIEVKRRWNLVQDQIELIFEIIILGTDKKYKCKRTLNQLIEFHEQFMIEMKDFLDQHIQEQQEIKFLFQQIKESMEVNLISNVQKYCAAINSKIEYACTSLQDFIQLPTSERQLLEEAKKMTQYQLQNKSSIIKRKEALHYKWDIADEYLPYFDIKIAEYQRADQQYVQYIIQLQFQNDSWVVNKRFTEFYELNETIRHLNNVKGLPPLPQKKLIRLSEGEIEERMLELEIYLKNILNDRVYHHYSLIKFIELKKDQEEKLQFLQRKIEQESQAITQIQFQGMGYEEAEGIIRYQFQIINGSDRYNIMKRFSQFDELHQVLKVRYQSIPSLPSKYTAIQQQIAPSMRSFNLTQYLQKLVKVQNIGESVHLRQFLDLKGLGKSYSSSSEVKSSSSFDVELTFNKLDQEDQRASQRLQNMKSTQW